MRTNCLLIATLFICLVVVTGCNRDESEHVNTALKGEDPVTFTYFNAANNGRNMDSNVTTIGKMFEKETGVNFKVEYPVGDIDTHVGVMIASGHYPDVLSPDVAVDKVVEAGAFIPLNDLIDEYAPNLKEVYEPYLDMMKHEDGNIYYIPFGASNGYIPNPNIYQGAFWIQRGVLKEFGYPEITTLDQYFDLIEAYEKKYPMINEQETIGFTALTYDWRFFTLANPPAHLAGYPNDGDVIVDMDTNEAKVYGNKDITKRYLQKLNEINSKGLFDNEAFISTYEEYLEKISSGRVLGFFDYRWQVGTAFNHLSEAGDDDREYMALPIVFDETIKDQYLDPPSFTANRGIGITINAEDPVRIMKFFDHLMKEENQKLVNWGIEGETYEVNDEGRFYRSKEQIALTNQADFREQFGFSIFEWYWPRGNGLYSDGNAWEPRRQQEVAMNDYTEEDRVLLDAYNIEVFSDLFSEPEERPWFPAWSANVEPGSQAAIFEQEKHELQRLWFPQMILADPNEFESVWDMYVEEFNQTGYEAFEQVMNEFIHKRLELSNNNQ
ncbi:ABC transporter substrate-binding protein [Halalkalibacter okhensis]|uniref:ABC transporter substrate-binding protein n=1 Tax=Halalkalibacter okhensis TaxID=333138 RepID=A0A0B0II28_9BACI|nr:ABC transporter substrate-binding protein [Halalkalibacter okhensis]KHF40532.1 ABC transporter substrate-binding protein [Halalkalibacter okhensis]